jgi:hypothetical protein
MPFGSAAAGWAREGFPAVPCSSQKPFDTQTQKINASIPRTHLALNISPPSTNYKEILRHGWTQIDTDKKQISLFIHTLSGEAKYRSCFSIAPILFTQFAVHLCLSTPLRSSICVK